MVTMSLFMLFGVMGLAIDLGWSYYRKQVAQSAADAAAMAAAVVAYNSTTGIITCGSNNVVCQATPTACPVITGNPANNIQNGCLYAKANGFTNGGNQTVTMSSSALGIAPNPTSFSILYTVTATVTETNPQLFSAVGGHQYGTVAVQSTAEVIQPPVPACIYALNQTASGALSVAGGSKIISMNCGIAVNSSSSSALVISGNSSTTITAAFEKIVGGFQRNGQAQISPTPITVSHFSDPLGNLPAPPTPTQCDHFDYSISNGSDTLGPGTFCGGITISGPANVTFNPGIYYIYGGGISFTSANSRINGTDVMFFNTDGRGVAGLPTTGFTKTSFAPIIISGQPNVTLSAPTSGTYSGVLFYKDRNFSASYPNNTDQITGQTQPTLTGTIYLPGDNLLLSGGVSTGQNQPAIIADTIQVSGGADLKVQTTSSGNSQHKFVALVQ
jgi:Putative Flp pilus-assembly TadE/G-like